jgi:hypothetical protein
MFMTNRLLDEARITHAGSGKDLTEARRAQFGITPKGTIGVVGMYSIDPSSYPQGKPESLCERHGGLPIGRRARPCTVTRGRDDTWAAVSSTRAAAMPKEPTSIKTVRENASALIISLPS